MNDEKQPQEAAPTESAQDKPAGPSLTLLYTLIGLALLAAITIALLIVRPFYLRR